MEKDKVIVVVRPNNRSTRYFYYWAKKPIAIAKEKGIKVVDLKVERATSKNIEKAMTLNPCMVFFCGYNDTNKLLGFNNEILIDDDSNGLFSNGTAEVLCIRDTKSNKCAYVGRNEPFVFIHSLSTYNPLDDEVAHVFLDPLADMVVDALNGLTVGEAFNKSKKIQEEEIRKYSDSEYSFIVPYIFQNMNSLILLGNEDAKIF